MHARALYKAVPLLMLCLVGSSLVSASCGSRESTNQKNNASYFYTQGDRQYESGRYEASVESFINAVKMAPDNPQFAYCAARAYAAAGKTDEALQWLDRALGAGFHFGLDSDPGFNGIRGREEYREILRRVQALKSPVARSAGAFTIQEPDLMPESIAYDPVNEAFYVGSTYKRKVILIDRRGVPRDFIFEAQDGLWSVFGMKADPARRILWVLSSVYRGMKNFDGGRFGMSAVFKFDLDKGNCIRKYVLDERPKRHSLNDLVVNGKGDVFITDDQTNCLYRISHDSDRLELFLDVGFCTYPNGICLSDDERYLYFSHNEGVTAVDMTTKACRPLAHAAGVTLCGIDGLYFYRDRLVGVQVYEPERLIEFHLAENRLAVDHAGIIEVNNPLFELPTTGVIVGGTLYYIANSQLRKFNNGIIYPPDKLNAIHILRVDL